MVNKPHLTVILGDFNTKSSLWSNNDITTYEGFKIDGVTSQFGLQQIIKEFTHFIGDSSSCIDLIFTTRPNLVMESGAHSSLHANCHQHNLCKIQSQNPLSPSLWTGSMVLPKG